MQNIAGQQLRFGTTYRFETVNDPKADRERALKFYADKKAAGVDAEYSLQAWTNRLDKYKPSVDWFVLTDEGSDRALTRYRFLKQLNALFTSKEKNRLPRWESLQMDKLSSKFEGILLQPLFERSITVK